MPQSRRGLAVAVWTLRILAIAAGMFAVVGILSLLVSRQRPEMAATGLIIGILSFVLMGAAATAIFYVLGEAGEILARLENQGERMKQMLEELRFQPSQPLRRSGPGEVEGNKPEAYKEESK
jgi:hypothetical protein